MNEDREHLLAVIEEQAITKPDQNLRNKIQSIIRSLQALENKKLRIEFEIRQQKKSLTRKREEFKRISKRNQVNLKLALENQNLPEDQIQQNLELLKINDQKLLLESYQVLDN